MAKHWTDTTFYLEGHEQPMITQHTDHQTVSFHIPGYMLDGRGFSICFKRTHLDAVRQLVQALEAIPDPGDPFPEEDAVSTTTPYEEVNTIDLDMTSLRKATEEELAEITEQDWREIATQGRNACDEYERKQS